MAVRHLLLVTEEPATAGAVAAALESNGRLAKEDVCRDVAELVLRLEAGTAPAALVDIDAAPAAILQQLEPVVRRFAATRFIVLSKAMQPELMLEAMQVGARHFMAKPSIPTTLRATLHRLCEGVDGHESRGSLVTVLSAGGGCGATTIAVNLAYEVAATAAAADRQPLLLADLDHVYGAVGAYLGLSAEHGLLDLLERSGAIDGELINTTALSAPGCEPLKVLVSTAAASLGDVAPHYARLAETIEACRQAYRVTVLDAPRVPMGVAADLAKASALTILALQLSVKDIRTARAMLSSLTARGAAPESILGVVNRYRRRATMIDLEEAKRVLGGIRIECLSNDYQAVAQSANYGQPLSKAAPRSPLRKELQQLASRIRDGSLARSRPVVTK